MKTKDAAIKVVKRWMISQIYEPKYKLVVLMPDSVSKYKSEEMMQFLETPVRWNSNIQVHVPSINWWY